MPPVAPKSPKTPSRGPRTRSTPRKAKSPRQVKSPRKAEPKSKPTSRASAKRVQIRDPTPDHITISSDASDDQRTVTPRRRPRVQPMALAAFASLQSLCTVENECLDALRVPGIMAEESVGETAVEETVVGETMEEKVVHWKAGVSESRPVAEHLVFLHELQAKSKGLPATAYRLPVAHIEDLEKRAREFGYHTHALIPPPVLRKEHIGILVIGHEKEAVDRVAEGEIKANGLGLLAGIVVGAVLASL